MQEVSEGLATPAAQPVSLICEGCSHLFPTSTSKIAHDASGSCGSGIMCIPCHRSFLDAKGLERHLRSSSQHRQDQKKGKGKYQPQQQQTNTTSTKDAGIRKAGESSSSEGHASNQPVTYTAFTEMKATPRLSKQAARKKWKKKGQRVPQLLSDTGHDLPEAVVENVQKALNNVELVSSGPDETSEDEQQSVYLTPDGPSIESSEVGSSAPPSAAQESFNLPKRRECIPSTTQLGPPETDEPAPAGASVYNSSNTAQSIRPVTTRTRTAIPCTAIQRSGIAEDIYHIDVSGKVRCLPCKKWFTSFWAFQRHYQDSIRHNPAESPNADMDGGPPPLVRPSSPVIPIPSSRATAIRTGSPTLAVLPRSLAAIPPGMSDCLACKLKFNNRTALQRHMASERGKHPYYCSDCTLEYADFGSYQTHFSQSTYCSPRDRAGHPVTHVQSHSAPLAILQQGQQQNRHIVRYPERSTVPAPLLSTKAANTDGQNEEEKNMPACPICFSPLAGETDVSATFCGHLFCAPCILEHLASRNDCPTCRKLITPLMLIPVYF